MVKGGKKLEHHKKIPTYLFLLVLFANIFIVMFQSTASGSCISDYGLRTDGTYLYRTMEDGIIPHLYWDTSTSTLDSNSTIEGKYCLNMSHTCVFDGFFMMYKFDIPIKPTKFSMKMIIDSYTNNSQITLAIDQQGAGYTMGVRFYTNTKKIRIGGSGATSYFTMPWSFDTIYTISFENINYDAHTYTLVVSNATSSESHATTFTTVVGNPACRFIELSDLTEIGTNTRVFIDDWTVGTQTIVTNDNPVPKATYAIGNADLTNDGSPGQNNTQFSNNNSYLFDTVHHYNSSYTYYFNRHLHKNVSWTINYNGVNHQVYCMVEYNNKLYAGEYGEGGDVLEYNPLNNTWRISRDGGGTLGQAMSLCVFNNLLYLGYGNNTWQGILKFNGTTWTKDYDFTSIGMYYVSSLCVYNNKLYAGLYAPSPRGDIWVNNSGWTKSYDGTYQVVRSLYVFNNKLYAGMGCYTPSVSGTILKFDGSTWSTNYSGTTDNIYAITSYNNQLYAAEGGNALGEGNIITFTSGAWSEIYGGSDLSILCLEVYNNKLYAGQYSTTGEGDIFSYDGSTFVKVYQSLASGFNSLRYFKSYLLAGQIGNHGEGDIYRYKEMYWANQPEYMNDTDENTYSSNTYSNFSELLNNHTGNITYTPDENISKVELRAKTNLSNLAYNGRIFLQPVWNNTNGSFYNTFAYSGSSGVWSDWIDITKDVNGTNCTWRDIQNLSCRVIANLSNGGIAYVGMVQLKVSVNLTEQYNNKTDLTGSYHTADTLAENIPTLYPGKLYHTRPITNTSYINSSSGYIGEEITFLSKPEAPTKTNFTFHNTSAINISWINGTGFNKTIIIKKLTGLPTTPYDGTIVYNGSLNKTTLPIIIGITIYYRLWSYTNWTDHDYWETDVNYSHFSDNGTNVSIGGLYINVYNESKPSQALTNWAIEIKNLNGSEVYVNNNCNNPQSVNATLCPQGDVTIRISRPGYRERIVYTTILPDIFYVANFYLPSLTNPATIPTNTTTDCTLRSYINSINITTYTTDKTITLSHTLNEINIVEIYNKSLYGTYGGWLYIPDNKFSYTETTVIINKTILDINTTMARASYYYYDCPGVYNPPQLYNAQIVETIHVGDNQVDQPVEGATITFKRYMNTTGHYEILSVLKSDSDGKVNLWLFPSQIYLVLITCNGYNDALADYIPSPPNLYGQTDLKTFRITRQTGGQSMPVYDTLFTNITYSLEPRGTRHTGGFTLYYNITSYDNKLEWYRLIVYYQPYNTNTWTLLYDHNHSDPGGGSISYTITNNTGRYSIEAWFKKTGYDAYEIYHTGSIIYFIVHLRATANLIPDEAYFIITIVLMLVGMGACILYFTTGPATGYVGLGIMAFMFYLHDITIDAGFAIGGTEQYISGWVIFGITFLIYTAALFLWSRQ